MPFDILSGKEAEDFIANIIKEHEEDDKRRPEKYDKFGYKWNEDTKYKWEEGMKEISGFGTVYEENCRFMVSKGLEFIDDTLTKYPTDTEPKFASSSNIFGLTTEMNLGAEELSKYLCWKTEDYFGKEFGPSGAQMHAVTNHIAWIRKHSWDEYIAKMKEPDKK